MPKPSLYPLCPLPGRIHFCGVCGRAMGGVAAALRGRKGVQISGSDMGAHAPMDAVLRESGVRLQTTYDKRNLRGPIDLVVAGPVILRQHIEIMEALRKRIPVISLPRFLQEYFLRESRNVVVAGTNGKTTTTAMLVHILRSAGRDPDYLIGGMPRDGTPPARWEGAPLAVLEGDEFSSGFGDLNPKMLHYRPNVAVLTNVCWDHPEIYRTERELRVAFSVFLQLLPPDGLLVFNGDDPISSRKIVPWAPCPKVEVGFGRACQHRLERFKARAAGCEFEFLGKPFALPLMGKMNALNAALATLAARHLGVSLTKIRQALESFQGVQGRQDIRIESPGLVHVSDEAYHPDALRALIGALKGRYPRRRVLVCLQPRSTGGRGGFQEKELPAGLAGADVVLLSDARDPMPHNQPGQMFRPGLVVQALRKRKVIVRAVGPAQNLGPALLQIAKRGDLVLTSLKMHQPEAEASLLSALEQLKMRWQS